MRENDDERPRDLLSVGQGPAADAVNQHPDPKHEEDRKETQQQDDSQSAQDSSEHSYSFFFSVSFCRIAFFNAGTCSSSFSNFTPVRLSSTGGSCAMICVTSPVSLLAPPPGPLPELMMTIFSIFASGSLMRPAMSGSTLTSSSMTAASLYCWNASAFRRVASAVALPCAMMMSAWARPLAL